MNIFLPLIYSCILLIIILLLTVIYLLVKISRKNKAQKETEEAFEHLRQYENKYNQLQLESLQAKLNPHLFKNILNSIQSHAYQTYFAMDKLANVLDYILYESRNRFVSPKEEMEFALNLIEIKKIKISPLFELKVKLKADEQDVLYEQQLLAPLVCVELIENAFKHADIQSPSAFISIEIGFSDHLFFMTVANKISPKMPLKKEKSGIGTETFEQRLKIIYKDNFKLEKSVNEDVFIANLKINLLEYKTKMLASG